MSTEWQEFINHLAERREQNREEYGEPKHTLSCGVAVGDTIETPQGKPGVVTGITPKYLEVEIEGLRNPKAIPFAGNTDLEMLEKA